MAIDPVIQAKADDIRMKVYGEQVRESLASGLEAMSADVVENERRQDSVESQWQSVINATTNLDVVSAPEIIAARNNEANLKARLDKEHQQVTAQLDQTMKKTEWISPFNYGVIGDGVADDTDNLQLAINEARRLKMPLIVTSTRYTFNISKPLYVDNNTTIDLGFSFINKTTNAIGSGSNLFNAGATTDSYAVDAFFIVKHPENYQTEYTHIKNVRYSKSAPNIITYGVYAPRMARCTLENHFSFTGITEFLAFGYMWFMMPKLDTLLQYGGKYTIKIANDGSDLGGSTSLNLSHIVGYDQDGVIDLYGAPYSVINNPMIDRNNGRAIQLNMCPGVTITSPSIEFNLGTFLHLVGSKVTVTTPRVLFNQGLSVVRHLMYVGPFSSLTIIDGQFSNYEGTFDSSLNFDLTIAGGEVTLINTLLPNNGNAFRSFTDGGTLTIINGQGGVTYRDSQGVGEKTNGKRSLYGTQQPTTGSWLKGEEIINLNPETGIEKWVCLTAGTPGTWETVLKYNRISKNGVAGLLGDGTTQTFTFDHNLGKTPINLIVSPENTTAGTADIDHFTSTTTTITLRFKNPVPSGQTAAVRWYVEALA